MSDYWTENGLVKPQQIVVCAACKVSTGVILCGARHWDSVMIAQVKAMNLDHKECALAEQGFIDQFGNFITREEAMQIVKINGQPFSIERNGGNCALFSEGLY